MAKKSFWKLLKDNFGEYARNSSVHGMKYIARKETSVIERLFWITVILLGVVCSVFLLNMLLGRYLSKPTTTNFSTTYTPITALPFPAITICNINRMLESKLDSFLGKLDLQNENPEELKKLLSVVFDKNKISYNETDIQKLEMFDRILENNDYSRFVSVLKRISGTCDEMLIKCSWSGHVVKCNRLFKELFTMDGICCSVNYDIHFNRIKNQSIYSGIGSGLKILINPLMQPVLYSELAGAGMKVSIHTSDEVPSYGKKSILSIGKIQYIEIDGLALNSSKDIEMLPLAQRDCIFPYEYQLEHFRTYSKINCLAECDINRSYEKCGCVPFYFAFSDKPVCRLSKMACISNVLIYPPNSEICTCPQQCDEIFYNPIKVSNNFIRSKYITDSFFDDVEITNTTIFLNIFLSKEVLTVIHKEMATSMVFLLSGFGGIFSLFLGCSLLSGVEILYYCSLRLYVKFKLNKFSRKTFNVNYGKVVDCNKFTFSQHDFNINNVEVMGT